MDNKQLKAWVCPNCGAALPELKEGEMAVKCSSCGVLFQIPQEEMRSGGVRITGNVVVHGDVVGRDRVVIVKTPSGKS